MKILWIDLNSSYAHSSLALPALHAQVKNNPDYQWDIVSATINENIGMVVDVIYRHQPDILAATCWLFNHESLIHIVSRAKALLPKACVILGGPEFLGENETFLRRNPFVDCVFRGVRICLSMSTEQRVLLRVMSSMRSLVPGTMPRC